MQPSGYRALRPVKPGFRIVIFLCKPLTRQCFSAQGLGFRVRGPKP